MIKLQILHKGLAFLLVPLALQVAFCVGLYQLVKETEALARREATYADVVDLTNDTVIQFGSGWSSIGSHILRTDHPEGIDPEIYKQRLAHTLKNAEEAWGDLPAVRERLKHAQTFVDDQYRLLKAIKKEPSGAENIMPLFLKFGPQVMKAGGEVTKISAQMAPQRAVIQNLRKESETKRKQLEKLIFIGIAADIVLTVILLLFFLSDMTSRLKILVGNAQSLPRGEELQRQLGGTDELAYLDSVIHDASRGLKEAAEQRKSLMQMVAHDLRAPLNAAKFTLDQLSISQSDDNGNLHDRLKGARDSLNLSLSLLEDLLTIERLESGKLDLNCDLIDLKSIAKDAFDGVAMLAKNKNLQLIDETDSVVLDIDRLRILQVLNNLLSNAAKYAPNGSKITLSSQIHPQFVKVLVSDEGPGIALEKQEQLFRKFSRLDETSTDGIGLGLAITKLIVGAHNGTVGVDSAPGKGSTFWFTLPTPVDLTRIEQD